MKFVPSKQARRLRAFSLSDSRGPAGSSELGQNLAHAGIRCFVPHRPEERWSSEAPAGRGCGTVSGTDGPSSEAAAEPGNQTWFL